MSSITIAEQICGIMSSDFETRYDTAEHLDAPPLLRFASKDKEQGVRRNVADEPNTPHDVLEYFVDHDNEWVVTFVARNTNAPTRILLKILDKALNDDEYKSAIFQLAWNPNMEPSIINEWALLRSQKHYLKSEVCPNSLLPYIWRTLRKEALANPALPQKTINRLAKSTNNSVLLHLVQNPKLPDNKLFSIEKRGNRDISYNIIARKNLPVKLLRYYYSKKVLKIDLRIANDPNLPVDIMQEFTHAHYFVRQNLASNPNLTPELFKILACDKAITVRERLVNHPKITREALKILSKDKFYGPREGAKIKLKKLNNSAR